MGRLGAALATGTLTFIAVVANAAPADSGPRATPTPTPTPAVGVKAAALSVEGEVFPQMTKCGEPAKGRVKLTNKTGKAWQGVVSFATPQQTNLSVSLGASGNDATKTIDVQGANLDCKKPISTQELKVFPFGAPSNAVVTKVMKPKSISAGQGFNMPPPTETKVWLRRVTLNATCGGQVKATATLQLFGSASQEAKMKLGFGQYVSNPTVQVPANQPTDVAMPVPTPLDCQGAGIPGFEYTLLSGLGASGKLEPQEVTFE